MSQGMRTCSSSQASEDHLPNTLYLKHVKNGPMFWQRVFEDRRGGPRYRVPQPPPR